MNLFDKFAQGASQFVSRAWFFVFCVLLVIVWAPSLPLFGKVDTWQLVINTVTTIITFLLVALLQNSQWRSEEAMNRKLNAIAEGLADTMESFSELMSKLEIPDQQRHLIEHAGELRQTVGLEDRISSSDGHKEAATSTRSAS